jgi:hypothetical protein
MSVYRLFHANTALGIVLEPDQPRSLHMYVVDSPSCESEDLRRDLGLILHGLIRPLRHAREDSGDPGDSVAVAVLGQAAPPMLTAFDGRFGDWRKKVEEALPLIMTGRDFGRWWPPTEETIRSIRAVFPERMPSHLRILRPEGGPEPYDWPATLPPGLADDVAMIEPTTDGDSWSRLCRDLWVHAPITSAETALAIQLNGSHHRPEATDEALEHGWTGQPAGELGLVMRHPRFRLPQGSRQQTLAKTGQDVRAVFLE